MAVERPCHRRNGHLVVAAHEDIREALAIDIAADRELGVGDALAAADDNLEADVGRFLRLGLGFMSILVFGEAF